MFRRTNGRPPPLLLGGLILFIIILSYSYWTLNTQNNDVLQSVEKLQANLKIGEVKIEQSERKMSALQDLLHEKEEAIKQSENKLLQQEDNIRTYNSDLKKRDYEITTLKNDIIKLQEKVQTLEDKITECEGDNEKILKENDLLMSQRDDAITALGKRDDQISELSRKLDQSAGAPHENSVLSHHQAQAHVVSSNSSPLLGPGQLRVVQQPLSIKAVDKGLQGLHFHGAPVLLRDAPDAPRPRPRFSVLDDIAAVGEGAAGGVAAPPQPPDQDQGEGVLPQPLKDSAERQSPHDVGPVAAGHLPPLVGAAPPLARSGRSSPLLSSTYPPFPAQQLLHAESPAPQQVLLRPYSHPPGAPPPNVRPQHFALAAPKIQYKLPVLDKYHPAQYNFNHQPIGLHHHQLAINHQPLGVIQQPLGMNHQPLGVIQQPMGMNHQSLQINQQPFGMNQQSFGMNQLPLGTNHQLLRMNQQQQLYPVPQPHEQHLQDYRLQQRLQPMGEEPFDLSQYHNRADFEELQQAVRLLTKQRPLQHPGLPAGDTGHQPPRDVLPQPPGFQDNLDAAVDEVARPGEEDPLLPDQDPGGEVARQEQRLQDPRLHQHSVHDGGDVRIDHFGGGDEEEEAGGAPGANNQDFVDDGGNLVGGRGIDSPLIAANRDDNEGGEVETGDQQPAPADQELLENGAKENFFGDDPPLRLHISGNNDNVLANEKNTLDDNMVLQ